jgi:hypothetical protein
VASGGTSLLSWRSSACVSDTPDTPAFLHFQDAVSRSCEHTLETSMWIALASQHLLAVERSRTLTRGGNSIATDYCIHHPRPI